jgi:hypothetical protein
MLEQERDFYDAHLEEWLGRLAGRVALIKGQELIGTFDTVEDAIREGGRRYGLQPFLVRRVENRQEPVKIPALMFGLLNGGTQRPAPGPSATT